MRQGFKQYPEQKALILLDKLLEKHGQWLPERYDIVKKQFELNREIQDQHESFKAVDPILQHVYDACKDEVYALNPTGEWSKNDDQTWVILLTHLYDISMLQSIADDLLRTFKGSDGQGALRKTDLVCLDKAVEVLSLADTSINWTHQRQVAQALRIASVRCEFEAALRATLSIHQRLNTTREQSCQPNIEKSYHIENLEIEALEALRGIKWDWVTTASLSDYATNLPSPSSVSAVDSAPNSLPPEKYVDWTATLSPTTTSRASSVFSARTGRSKGGLSGKIKGKAKAEISRLKDWVTGGGDQLRLSQHPASPDDTSHSGAQCPYASTTSLPSTGSAQAGNYSGSRKFRRGSEMSAASLETVIRSPNDPEVPDPPAITFTGIWNTMELSLS